MTANAFASVSLDPMLVLVCVDHSTRTHAHLHTKKRFGMNVLCEDQKAITEYYARPERTHETPKPRPEPLRPHRHGTPVLHGALAYWNAGFIRREDAGDHTIFIAEVEDVIVAGGSPCCSFAGSTGKWGPR